MRSRALAALGARNLVLVGFMGTGKSTLGRAVARVLGRPFRDTDALVVARVGSPIREIFAREGEAGFRRHEAAVVAQAASATGYVLATGGGALANPDNLHALRANGLLIALHARPEVILARVGGRRAGAHRPLLDTPDPLARISELLKARAPLYAEADLELNTSELGQRGATRALLELVGVQGRRWGQG